METVYLRLTITDIPAEWVDERQSAGGLARVTRSFWYRLPRQWCPDGTLLRHRRWQLMDALYGPHWRQADAEGSRYLVLELHEEVLREDRVRDRPWLVDLAGCYVWDGYDTVRPAAPAEL